MVQGSRQEKLCITSELRTEPKEVGCAGCDPIQRNLSAAERQNKSGTAEVQCLCLLSGDKGILFSKNIQMEV